MASVPAGTPPAPSPEDTAAARASTTVLRAVSSALDRVGDALVRADVDGLLTLERELEAVASGLARLPRLGPADGTACRLELERARTALARCRRLGASMRLVARSTEALRAGAYDRSGAVSPRARVGGWEAKG